IRLPEVEAVHMSERFGAPSGVVDGDRHEAAGLPAVRRYPAVQRRRLREQRRTPALDLAVLTEVRLLIRRVLATQRQQRVQMARLDRLHLDAAAHTHPEKVVARYASSEAWSSRPAASTVLTQASRSNLMTSSSQTQAIRSRWAR